MSDKKMTAEAVQEDKAIMHVVLNHKNFGKDGKSFPKDVAVRMLKNQMKQKGFRNAYSINKVVRKGDK